MDIILGNQHASFRPWRPELGRVFSTVYAFDSETTLIDAQRPWIIPAYVIGAAYDGQRGFFITREGAAEFFQHHRNLPVVMHNAPFDLDVLTTLNVGFDVYELVENHLVWDTQLLHQLHALGTEGHTARGKGQATLEHCVEHYLGHALPKEVLDSEGRNVRTSYGRFLRRPPQEIEPIYLEYLAKDVMATLMVYSRLREKLLVMLQNSHRVWGFVSPAWLSNQVQRWGLQTHHIQLKAAIVLRAITAIGLGVDLDHRDDVLQQLDCVLNELRTELRRHGYLPGQKGSSKALQEILRRLERQHPDLKFLKTPNGSYATSREALLEVAESESFVRDLLHFKETEKLKSSFLAKMGRGRMHPSFNPLMVSGRTSSFGEINAQNLPRDDRVRGCFVPSAGSVFLDADYATLEMATLAQTVIGQFGVSSRMAEAINAGQDLHRLVAARVTGKHEDVVTKDERQKAKPINFGKPGGMGHGGLKGYAKTSYSVGLSDEEVEMLSNAWFDLFPEMKYFLYESETIDVGLNAASDFNLTPLGYFEHTGSRRFLDHPENAGRETEPHRILGWMFLKAIKELEPRTGSGRAYLPAELDYFWDHLTDRIDVVPQDCHHAVQERKPSPKLRNAVMNFVGRASCVTFTGRLRANASYCARHNTLFQGLAADGTKLALWLLWRAGYRIVNFVHDEVLIEIPLDSDWTMHAEHIKQLMIDGMRGVVPDVRIDVEYSASDRWSKSAEAIFDESGRLQLWSSGEARENISAVSRS